MRCGEGSRDAIPLREEVAETLTRRPPPLPGTRPGGRMGLRRHCGTVGSRHECVTISHPPHVRRTCDAQCAASIIPARTPDTRAEASGAEAASGRGLQNDPGATP